MPNEVNPLKTIHQRNKSMSALSLVKGIAANPRRTAFADVSNTRKVPLAQDDLVVASKTKLPEVQPLGMVKEAIAKLEEPHVAKPKALQRPAQRPLNANTLLPSGLSNALPIEPQAAVLAATSKQHDILLVQEDAVPVRRTITKRHTTVFKEVSASTEVPSMETKEVAIVAAPLQSLAAPTSVAEVAEPAAEVASKATVNVTELAAPVIEHGLSEYGLEDVSLPAECISPDPISRTNPPAQFFAESDPAYIPKVSETVFSEPYHFLDEKVARQSVGDIGEYWDEEDEDEYFDAEGYVTARSIRSLGDNTTGGMSVVLAPRVTARVQRELAAAEAWVAENTQLDEIEDEAWDSSMVAEYAPEIFEYMRDLEVGHCSVRHGGALAAVANQHVAESHAAQPQLHGQPSRDPVVDAVCSR
jgi:G2/mitotic-specific cyclin 3/4